ncbi:transforming acidic coiled-coil-containing protein 1 isoform X2 [Wyeomyia smithii]|uniref:transforming acidic coiled-coil-containing protein 1 isoform X2 n=1 Tax=Wyeomyia smithii TaxID=174621 RepID=UPI002468092F|nr:transforming acidic coiled-coil-containing protein 1 isoform X2 [Wyeomyia smithii]
MSDNEVVTNESESEETTETPKKGRGRPKKEGGTAEADSAEPGGRAGGTPEPETVTAENFPIVEKLQSADSCPLEFEFRAPPPPDSFEPVQTISILEASQQQHIFSTENEFQPAQTFQFAASDFDCLLSRGGDIQHQVPRDSLLLKFDPLLKVPAAASARLGTTEEEKSEGVGVELAPLVETAPAAEEAEGGEIAGVLLPASGTCESAASSSVVSLSSSSMSVDETKTSQTSHCADEETDGKMSVDNTIILDCESSTERNMSCTEPDQDLNSTNELDKKQSKNESLKTDELEQKLKEAEIREETLLKRITDKDKTISKMSGVVEAYERAIAELIAEKEQTAQNYEKTCEALKADSEINAQHLESLEKTFSDLHAKYERLKAITVEYKEREEELVTERNRFEENLRMQEKRYENMKSHAMTQLEIANNKLSEIVQNHAQEVTKLKALLKKEEIYRASVNEQLSQKTRENEELVKICEELINGGTTN